MAKTIHRLKTIIQAGTAIENHHRNEPAAWTESPSLLNFSKPLKFRKINSCELIWKEPLPVTAQHSMTRIGGNLTNSIPHPAPLIPLILMVDLSEKNSWLTFVN
ncbi:MAG TPA: hypothetical protein VIM41_06970 [Gammaproteobacteria bacterium]